MPQNNDPGHKTVLCDTEYNFVIFYDASDDRADPSLVSYLGPSFITDFSSVISLH